MCGVCHLFLVHLLKGILNKKIKQWFSRTPLEIVVWMSVWVLEAEDEYMTGNPYRPSVHEVQSLSTKFVSLQYEGECWSCRWRSSLKPKVKAYQQRNQVKRYHLMDQPDTVWVPLPSLQLFTSSLWRRMKIAFVITKSFTHNHSKQTWRMTFFCI